MGLFSTFYCTNLIRNKLNPEASLHYKQQHKKQLTNSNLTHKKLKK